MIRVLYLDEFIFFQSIILEKLLFGKQKKRSLLIQVRSVFIDIVYQRLLASGCIIAKEVRNSFDTF